MAVKLLVPKWNHSAGTIVRDLPADVERDLASSGMVSWYLDGGTETAEPTTWDGNTQFDRALAMRDETIQAVLSRPLAPTGGDVLPAGTRWLNSQTGTFYDTVGGGVWKEVGKFNAFNSATVWDSNGKAPLLIEGLNQAARNYLLAIKNNNGTFAGTISTSGGNNNKWAIKNNADTTQVEIDVSAGTVLQNVAFLVDGVAAPPATSGLAKIYIDGADGDLKVIFGDGTIKTIAVDT